MLIAGRTDQLAQRTQRVHSGMAIIRSTGISEPHMSHLPKLGWSILSPFTEYRGRKPADECEVGDPPKL